MKTDEQIAEEVAMRLDGKKLYRVSASEIVYYEKLVWALDQDEAVERASEDGDWGDATDGSNFEITYVELAEE